MNYDGFMNLLLIEDDQRLSEHISKNLITHNFSVTTVCSVDELEQILFSEKTYDILVMDRLLGNHDSKDYLLKIRKKWQSTPVLILSAISTPNEKADLINLGADDYLGKPFSNLELVARLNGLLRRRGQVNTYFSRAGDAILNTMTRTLTVHSATIQLSAKEFMILKLMFEDAKRIWSKNDLLDAVWGQNSFLETNVVEATITNLRRKLQDLKSSLKIQNMRNAGYWIEI